MRFCTSCGAEIIPGNKFCVQCGAPVEQSTIPESPASAGSRARAFFSGMPKKNMALLIIGGILVLAILMAIVVGSMPPVKTGKSSGPSSGSPVTVMPTGYTVVSTPESNTTIIPEPAPTSNIIQSERFGSNYRLVYSLSENLSFGQKETFSQNLTNPPLFIRFNLDPVKINRHLMVNIGTSIEHMENTTEVSPAAWFEVNVFNATDGGLVDSEGFGNDYSDMTNQEFMVREPGNYRIEMSGHEVFANVTILTGIP